ncbi:hypothetical protein VMCG_06126 [Cytospora schulzeri]|uniref:AMMECR1 domain-containing protein n=1 Tax=Cytospora schulzeri TaxID=448051 RepID=A0A423WGG7_9PEZI|nr:hypothetical protein VMCG_06126 [Valsa malicola]
MATVEHCLYCFESLAAELEGREPMDLDDVQKSYAEYTAQLAADDDDDDNEEEEEEEEEEHKTTQPKKKLPALRRLVGSAPSDNSLPSSTGSGSSSSTSLSANTDATSVTTTTTNTITPVTDPEAEYPLFVTWNKLSPSGSDAGEYNLRGCIGTFEAQPLADGLSSYAVIAALHDSRFHRVTLRELPTLQCAVTLLTDFEDAEGGILDWEVGVHGIRISFQWEGRRYGSTYLPDVAREQGWTREQALMSLMRKAGWEGRRDRWREVAAAGGMRVVRYRGDKEAVEFGEYKAWREWIID